MGSASNGFGELPTGLLTLMLLSIRDMHGMKNGSDIASSFLNSSAGLVTKSPKASPGNLVSGFSAAGLDFKPL